MDINDHLINFILNKNNDKNKESKTKNEKPLIINTLILNSANIYSFEIKNIYQQIECLSLRDSFLKNISFILNLPNIYYLDLYGNPIENYKPLIKIGTFGFLCISPPLNYFEKQILSLKSLNVIILQAEIKDKGIYNNFLLRNPNILVLNNTIIDFGKKIRTFNAMINFRYYIQNFLMEQDDFPNINNNNNNKKTTPKSINSDALNNRDIFLEKRLKTKQKKVVNKKCLEIIKFYDEYNKNLFEIYKNNKMNFNQDILCVEEKKKFLMIYNAFNYIGNFFSKNNNYYIYKSKTNLNENLSSNYPNINIEIFNNLKFLQYKEFVLSIIILYLFSILSKGITYFLILLIFKKTDYYNANNKNKTLVESDLKLLLDIDKSFLFAFYFKIYDILFEATGKNMDLNKLYEIQDRLKMIIIADKINEILSHQKNFINNYKMNTDFMQKNKIINKDFIRFLFDIKIFHKIFNIIQFVNDFIIFNNLITKLGHDFPEDMHFFTEVQGLILINFDKSNEIKESMADKNYNKIQINNLLNNKFFFKNQNYNRTKQNNSLTFYNYKHKIFYPNKKKMNYVENLKPFNEVKKEKEELIKQNYINNVLNSFFKVVNENTNNPKKEFINNLKLNNLLLNKNKHRRNNSRQYEINNNINNYLSKTYSNYKNQNNLNNEVFRLLGKTTNNINKLKLLSSPIKTKKRNKKTINLNIDLKDKNNLFNNDLLNLINTNRKKIYKNSRYNSNELNLQESINKNRKNKLFLSYDYNKNKKQTNQYILTVNKKFKKYQYSLRLFKKGIITNNNNLNSYNNFKIEDKKPNLREFNTVSYSHQFNNYIRKKSSH